MCRLFALDAIDETKGLAAGFFQSGHIASVLSLWASHKEGRRQPSVWMSDDGFDLTKEVVNKEMDTLTAELHLGLDNVIPEMFLNF